MKRRWSFIGVYLNCHLHTSYFISSTINIAIILDERFVTLVHHCHHRINFLFLFFFGLEMYSKRHYFSLCLYVRISISFLIISQMVVKWYFCVNQWNNDIVFLINLWIYVLYLWFIFISLALYHTSIQCKKRVQIHVIELFEIYVYNISILYLSAYLQILLPFFFFLDIWILIN